MKSMLRKVLFAVLTIIFLLFAAGAFGSSETNEPFYVASTRYDTAIDQLENWLELIGQPVEKLEQIIDVFDNLENYEMSRAFGYYTRVLMKTVEHEFDYNYKFWSEMLLENTEFQEYLSNTIKSRHIGTVENLLNYAKGLEAELQGDYEQAASYYIQCLNYYDASKRYEKTGGTENRQWYEQGLELMEQGNLAEALKAFEKANGYSDSFERIEFLKSQGNVYTDSTYGSTVKIGDTIFFGRYEQDDSIDGSEKIEWLVLDQQDEQCLLISKYVLDNTKYNEKNTFVTWEQSTIRQWLNDDFISTAFTEEEQAGIIETYVDNQKEQNYPGWNTDGGKTTLDRLFLLSYTEAKTYFTDDESRKCAPTKYAIQKGTEAFSDCKTREGKPTCGWWLRSPGPQQNNAMFVYKHGEVQYSAKVSATTGGVRPAVWVDLRTIERHILNPALQRDTESAEKGILDFSAAYPGQSIKLRTLSDDSNRVMAYTGPGKQYQECGAYKPSKQKAITAFFAEDDYVFIELSYQTVENRYLYIQRSAFDTDESIPERTDTEYITGTTNKTLIPLWGPDEKYQRSRDYSAPEGTSVQILFQYGNYMYAEYRSSSGLVRMWLPADGISIPGQ